MNMAHIKPFRGVIYNPDKIADLKKVVTPPYDVVSREMQEDFYNLNPHNIIRLILGKEMANDTARNNKYTRARLFLNTWLKEKVLTQEKKPCIYIYRQIYLHDSKKRVRTGFLALMKIEDPHRSSVLPHEYTLAKPRADRLNLIKQAKSNLSPIFSLYYEKDCFISKVLKDSIKKSNSMASIDFEGVTHQIWRISDSKTINAIRKAMHDKRVVIADGHHRYEVALKYRNSMRKRKGYNGNADYVMMYFTNLREADNVTILSTHRLLKDIGHFNKWILEKRLEPFFDITPFNTSSKMLNALAKDKKRPRFGIYLGRGKYLLVSLKKSISIPKIIDGDGSSQWKRLDVTILHNFVIKNLLCLKDFEDNVKYVRDPRHVVELVDSGGYKIAFFLNPTKAHQVREVAERGEMMPQKSTYFYPKILAGFVINKF